MTVTLIEWLGNVRFAYLATDASDEPLIMQMQAGERLEEGQSLNVGASADDCHLFDSDGKAQRGRVEPPGSMAA